MISLVARSVDDNLVAAVISIVVKVGTLSLRVVPVLESGCGVT